MTFDALGQKTEIVMAIAVAAAVMLVILVVAWPFLENDNLSRRLKKFARERDRTRQREQQRVRNKTESTQLRSEPKRFYRTIVGSMNLAKQAEDSKTAALLKKAGYRGPAPVITFVALRLLLPLSVLLLSALYLFILVPDLLDFPFNVLVVTALSLFGYYLPGILVRNTITKRQLEIRRVWPDALDLLLICVEAGMSVELAFRRVAAEIADQSETLADELNVTTAEMAYLPDRRLAYDNLGQRTDLEGVKAVMTSLVQAERYGTSIGSALRVLAKENRDLRMLAAEKKAAALPPKLTVPMILFFLPVLFAVIVTPAIIQLLATL